MARPAVAVTPNTDRALQCEPFSSGEKCHAVRPKLILRIADSGPVAPPLDNSLETRLAAAEQLRARPRFALQVEGQLKAENLVLRPQIGVLRRRMPKRPAPTNIDRLLFISLYRWFPSTAGALVIVRPETIVRWRRECLRSSSVAPSMLSLRSTWPGPWPFF
jgi:hypothetical protein